jgi:hypothetical protein
VTARVATALLVAGAGLMLSGCVAAVIPVIAAGTIAKKKMDQNKTPDTPQPTTGPRWTKSAEVAPPVAGSSTSDVPAPVPLETVELLPPPVALGTPGAGVAAPAAALSGSYSALVSFALNEADRLSAGEAMASQMLIKDFDIDKPKYQDCASGRAAVALDFDDAGGTAGDTPLPGLGAGLGQLRKAGVAILWFTNIGAAGTFAIRDQMKESGLDPEGADRIYARAKPSDRKQTLRQDAARDYCIVALAGDTKTDLEEAYGYLRDPELGHAIDRKWNAGWFLLPPPFVAQSKKEEANALDSR